MSADTLNQTAQPAVLINPFPGLRPFEFEESHLFFGRDGQSERLIAKLAATRFLAVVGTSGSGKSSLVRAGLLPALYSGFMPSAGSAWRIAVMRPGNDPLGNLARALNHPDVFGSDDEANRALQVAITEATLRRGSLGLVESAREQQLPASENLLIVADQFEELFRVDQGTQTAEHENDRAAFVKLLLAAKAQRELNIYVVLTMRSDYLGDCAQFWDLPEAINESQYLIPRLTREQIREAITGPIYVGGAEATPRLINRLLNDVGDNPDQLPILQHALMRTWEKWVEDGGLRVADSNRQPRTDHRQPIDLSHYEAIGGMANALSLHADEAFNQLPDDHHRVVAERVFKALTEKGPDNREIRRPVTLGTLCLIADASSAEVKQVIETFRAPGRSFLMPPPDKENKAAELKAESLIDISHESLMRNWTRLRDWVEDEAKSARIYRRLAETAALYLENKAGLWRDPDLQLALDWQSVTRPNKHWGERYDQGYDTAVAFLEKSAAQRQADLEAAESQQRKEAEQAKRELAAAQALAEAQKLRAEEQAQAASKIQRRAWAAGLLALVALLAAWLAFRSYRTAEAQRTTAEKQSERAQTSENIAIREKTKADIARDDAEKAAKDAEEQKQKAVAKQREAEAAKLAEELQRKLVAQTNQQLASSLTQSGSLLYVSRGLLAQAAMDQQDYIRANDFIEASFPAPGSSAKDDLRSFDWFYRWRQLHDEKATLKGHRYDVTSVAWSPDGRTLASGSDDSTVKLWDLASGQEKATLTGHGSNVTAVTFAPDGRTLASGSWDKTVKLWDVASGQEKATLKGHDGLVYTVAFAPDSLTLASAGGDETVTLWDVASRQVGATLKGHAHIVTALGWSPDGRMLASGSWDGTVKLWDVASRQVGATLKGHKGFVNAVTFAPDGRTLASGSDDRTVKLWDVASVQGKATLTGHKGDVNAMAFAPDSLTLASAGDDGTVKLWDVASGQEEAMLTGHGVFVTAVAFAPDGRTLASGSVNKTIKLWDVTNGQEKATLKGHVSVVSTVAFSPDGRTLASGSDDSTVKLWDVASGEARATLTGHKYNVTSVAWSPDGRTLASAGNEGRVKLWDVVSGQARETLKGHGSRVTAVTFSPDGRTLASGSDDRTVKLWDVASGQERATLKGHDSRVVSVVFAPDGRTVASGGWDSTVKLWDVASGQEKATLKGHKGFVNAVTFAPDGRTLASAGGGWEGPDGKEMFPILLWRGATDAEVARQCNRCGRKQE